MIRQLRRLAIALSTSAAVLIAGALTPDGTIWAENGTQAVVAEASPALLLVPPPAGITLGLSGVSSPAEFVDAQPFSIQSLAAFDIATQSWSTYVPGAPSFANSLTSDSLTPESIVFARRTSAGSLRWSPPPIAGPPVASLPNNPNTFLSPPPDGLTLGVAGTTDPAVLAAVQLFNVQTINVWDIAEQRYYTYIPGAPAIVNTLTSQTLAASDFVWLKANGGPTGAILFEDTELEARLVAPALGHTIRSIGPALFGELIDLGGGHFIYAPLENFFGIDTFSYTEFVDGVAEQRTFRLIVLPINDAPVAVDDTAIALPNIVTIIEVLENDTDAEDDELSILQTTQPLGGIVAVAGNTITYTALPGFSGIDSFTYEVTDGIAEPGEDPESTGTIEVIVSGAFGGVPFFGGGGGGPIAGPPPDDDGTDDTDNTGGDEPVVEFLTGDSLYLEVCDGDAIIDVLANDAGDGMTVLAVAAVSVPALGAATNGGTNVVYTPPEDCSGDDSFSYSVLDASEVEHTASVVVYLGQVDSGTGDGEEEPANQAPTAIDDAATTFEVAPVTIDLLANDSDPDDDPISITAIGEPNYGTVIDNGDGTITYTAPNYYGGTVTFTYTITDGVTGDSTANVTITVSRGTVSAQEPIVVYAGSSVTVQVITPSDFVQLESVTQGSHGTISMNQAAGTFTYQPDSGFIGSDWISWELLFSHGGTAETTIQIDIVN
jgi:Big-like domain-containing protein